MSDGAAHTTNQPDPATGGFLIYGGRMPDKLIDYATAVMYAIVAVSGAAGGCMVIANHALRGRNVTALLFVAYALLGAVFGIAGVAAMLLFAGIDATFEKLVLLGLFFGVVGSTALASANMSIRFLLRRLGIEVDVRIKRIKDE